MGKPNLEELRTSGALQDLQVSSSSYQGLLPRPMLRHSQIGSWWERALAIAGLVILVLTVVVNLWRFL
jgi:hypothetical protein